jgi:DNA-binding response OmpR family regulator
MPDLVLLDVRLPDIDGFEICRRMRKLEQVATVPIIIITAKSGIAAKTEGFKAGADDYITKPFEIAELPLRVAAQFRRMKLPSDEHRGPDGLQARLSGLRMQRWQEYLIAAATGLALGGTVVGLALILG